MQSPEAGTPTSGSSERFHRSLSSEQVPKVRAGFAGEKRDGGPGRDLVRKVEGVEHRWAAVWEAVSGQLRPAQRVQGKQGEGVSMGDLACQLRLPSLEEWGGRV